MSGDTEFMVQCDACDGDGRVLADHDGRAGYDICGACNGSGVRKPLDSRIRRSAEPALALASAHDEEDLVAELEVATARAEKLKQEIARRNQASEFFLVTDDQKPRTFVGFRDTYEEAATLATRTPDTLMRQALERLPKRVIFGCLAADTLATLKEGVAENALLQKKAAEIPKLESELDRAQKVYDQTAAARDSLNRALASANLELNDFRNLLDKKIAEGVVAERERLTKATADINRSRDVTHMNALRDELARFREDQKRRDLAATDNAELHTKIAAESRFASQLESVTRLALGQQPCPEEGAFSWSPAAKAVDMLQAQKYALKDQLSEARSALQKGADVFHVQAALEVLERPEPHIADIPKGKFLCAICNRVPEDPVHIRGA